MFTAQATPASGRIVTATDGTISGTAVVDIVAGTLTTIVVTPTATLVPRPTATPPPAATPTSDGGTTEETPAIAPPSDTIAVGGYARVAASAGLSFRQTPGTGGALIQVLDAGTVLEVIDGPEEVDGYTWWQLRKSDDEQEGWSAAGSGEDIFLEPAPAP